MSKRINNRYQLEKKLGAGGMGIVHQALDRLNGEKVALKQVQVPTRQLQFMSRTPSMVTSDLRLSLAREFELLASLRHPNIISVLDYGFDQGGQPFYTMTYLPDAKNLLTAGQHLSQQGKLQLIQQLLQALAYLHRRGIYHRDLKPDNVLVVDGQLRVLDFGLATARSEKSEGTLGGTTAYWAPELWAGESFAVTADLFAAGIIAFELLTGQHPFGPV
jgi:serine/threonine protein kinase